MVVLKNARELVEMSEACKISAQALHIAQKYMRAGVSTKEIDEAIHREIVSHGAKPSFLGYGGFPASACISVNHQVIHGIPSSKVILKDGDIVSVDVGAFYKGYHGDNAFTYRVGEVSQEAAKLLEVTNECLYRAIEQAKPGNRMGDISYAVESYARSFGYGVVKNYVGHGVGRNLHEDPEVPNFGTKGKGIRLVKGMTLAIEPMINLVGDNVKMLSDGWTVETVSGSLSAHFEHTIVITDDGAKILTKI
ncbi:type I methionyl aminopeptidase [Paludicola sp. MB14-C6]|uniref:type I methionyl aminopeptidase n=1 Tax=Paludihabitans sp. MB14-C6 TaxID=3070656 RepID=UPI0027DB8B14|nr:type I methionyl aminopeptidase [Paludicola sp. MB14-C6]WMJ24162.1 type I methionyl aminopeptidase [Paludicola sp. MB14-C6]